MSLHQAKLQKDGLSLHRIPLGMGPGNPETDEQQQNRESYVQQVHNQQQQQHTAALSEIDSEYTNTNNQTTTSTLFSEVNSANEDVSWTTMSEIDSQYTKRSRRSSIGGRSSVGGGMELSMITDSEYEGSSDEYDDEDGLPPLRIVAATTTKPTNSLLLLHPMQSNITPTSVTASSPFWFPTSNTAAGNTAPVISPRNDKDTHSSSSSDEEEEQQQEQLINSFRSEQTGGNCTSESQEVRSKTSPSSRTSSKKTKKKNKRNQYKSKPSTSSSSVSYSSPNKSGVSMDLGFSPILPQSGLSEWKQQERLRDARDEVLHARQELATVSKHLEGLEEEHQAQIQTLRDQLERQKQDFLKLQAINQEQIATIRTENVLLKLQSPRNNDEDDDDNNNHNNEYPSVPFMVDVPSNNGDIADDGDVTTLEVQEMDRELEFQQAMADLELQARSAMDRVVSEHQTQIRVLQHEKDRAESNLSDALAKLHVVQSENETLKAEKHVLQDELEDTRKKVRFAEDQNSVLEFKVGDYRSKWEDSLRVSRQVESQLVTTRCDLQTFQNQAQQNQEMYETAKATACSELAIQAEKHQNILRSVHEQHTKTRQKTVEQLQAQCKENEALKNDFQLQTEEFSMLSEKHNSLQAQWKDTVAAKESLFADLARAREQSNRLQNELVTVQESMVRLEQDHQEIRTKEKDSLTSELLAVRESMACLVEQDQQHQRELEELRAQMVQLEADAKAAASHAESNLRNEKKRASVLEQTLRSDLERSESEAREQNLASTQELETLRQSIAVLVSKQEESKNEIAECKARESKLVADAVAARMESNARFDQAQKDASDARDNLLFQLTESKATIESLSSKNHSLESTVTDLQQERSRLEIELVEMTNRWKHSTANSSQLDKDIRLLKAELAASNYSVLRLESEQSKARSETKDLLASHVIKVQEQQSLLVSIQKQERSLRDELASVQLQQKRTEQDKYELQQQLDSARNKHSELRAAHKEDKVSLEDKIRGLQVEKESLIKESLNVSAVKEDLRSQLETLTEKSQELQHAKNDLEQELKVRTKEHGDLTTTLKDKYTVLESERDRFVFQIEAFSKKEQDLVESLESIQKRMEESTHKLISTTRERDELVLSLDEEKKASTRLEQENHDHQQTTTTLSCQYAQLALQHEQETEAMTARLARLETDFEAAQNDIRCIRDEKEKVDNELKAVRDENAAIKATYLLSEEKLVALLQEQEDLKSSTDDRIAHLIKVRADLEGQLQDSTRSREEVEASLQKTATSLEEANQSFEAKGIQVERLEAELNVASKSIRFFEKEQSVLEKEKDTLQELQMWTAEVHSALVTNLEGQLESANQKVSDLSSEKESMDAQIQTLQSDQIALEEQLRESSNSLEKTNRRLEQNETDRHRLMEQISDLEQNCKSLRAERSDALDGKEFVKALHSKAQQEHKELLERIQQIQLSKESAIAATRAQVLAEQSTLLDASKAELQCAQEQVDIWQQKHHDFEIAAAAELAEIMAEHSKTTENHEASIAFLQSELESVQRLESLAREDKERLQAEIDTLAIKESRLEQKYTEAMELLQRTTGTLKEVEVDRELLRARLSNLETDMERMSNEQVQASMKMKAILAAHEVALQENQVLIDKAQAEGKELKAQIIELERERESSKLAATSDKETMIALHAKHVDEMNTSSNVLKEQLVALEKHVVAARNEKTELQTKTESLANELATVTKDVDKTFELLTQAQNQLEQSKFSETMLKKNISELQETIHSLETEKSKAEAEIKELSKTAEIHMEELNKAKAATNAALDQATSFKGEIDALRKICDEEKKSLIAMHSNAMDGNRVAVKSLHDKLDASEKLASQYEQAKDELHGKVAFLDKELRQANAKFENALIDIAAVSSKLEQTEESKEGLQMQVSTLQEKFRAEQAASAEKIQQLLDCHGKESEEYDERLKKAMADVQTSLVELQSLRDSYDQLQASALEKREKTLSMHAKEIEGAKNTMGILQEKLDTAQKEVLDSRREKDGLQERLKSIEAEREVLRSELEAASKRIVDLESQVQMKEEENSELVGKVAEMASKFASLETEHAKATAKIDDLMKGRASAVEENNRRIEAAQKKATNAEEHKIKLQSEIEKLEDTLKSLNKNNSDLRSKQNLALSSIDELKAGIATAEREKNNIEADLRRAESREESLVQDLRLVSEENVSLKAISDSSAKEYKTDLDRMKSTSKGLSSDKDRLSSELLSLKENHAKVSELRDQFEQENHKLKDKLDGATRRNSELIENHRIETLGVRIQMDSLESEKNCLASQVEASKSARVLLERDLNENRAALDEVKSNLVQSGNENNRLNAELSKAVETIAGLEVKSKKEVALKEEMELTIKGLEQDIISKSKRIQDMEADKGRLETEVQTLQHDCTRLEGESKQEVSMRGVADEAAESLRSKLESEQAKSRSIETANEVLLREKKEMELKMQQLAASLKDAKATLVKERADHVASKIEMEKVRKEKTGLFSKLSSYRRRSRARANREAKLSGEIVMLKADVEKLKKERESTVKSTGSSMKKKNLELGKLRRQLKEAQSKISNLEESIGDLESSKQKAIFKVAIQKSVQSDHEEKIQALKRDLAIMARENAEEFKKTRKIAKLLKTTLGSVTRVSRMKMDVNLGYRDKVTGEYRRMPARAEYSGPVLDSKPHGAGMLKFECGDMYLGMFEHGEMSGEGSYMTSPGPKKKRRSGDHSSHKARQIRSPLLFKGHYDQNGFTPSKDPVSKTLSFSLNETPTSSEKSKLFKLIRKKRTIECQPGRS